MGDITPYPRGGALQVRARNGDLGWAPTRCCHPEGGAGAVGMAPLCTGEINWGRVPSDRPVID